MFEAGAKAADQYGVAPRDFTRFFGPLGYRLSTMERWLDSQPALTEREFVDNWRAGKDYYFIASPVPTC